MNLTNTQAIEILQALRALDGNEQRKYTFDLSTGLKIAKNIRILAGVYEDLDRMRTTRLREQGLVAPVPEDPASKLDRARREAAFVLEWQEVTRESAGELPLVMLPWKDMLPEKNAIQPTVLAALLPLISGLPE